MAFGRGKYIRKQIGFLVMVIAGLMILMGCHNTEVQKNNLQEEEDEGIRTEVVVNEEPSDKQAVEKETIEEQENDEGGIIERPSNILLYDPALKSDYAYRSFLQIPMGMAWGPDDKLYIADWAGHHVVVVDDGKLADLGLWKENVTLQESGPQHLAFDSKGNLYISNFRYIYRLDTEGNLDILLGDRARTIGGIAVSNEDELYYADMVDEMGRLLKWNPEGDDMVIVDNVLSPFSMVFGLDNTLYLTQMGYGDVLQVDVVSGDMSVFAKDVCGFDPCFLAIDQEGDLWVRGIQRINQLSLEGDLKPFTIDGNTYPYGPYTWHTSAGIAVDPEGGVWVASYNSMLIHLLPEAMEEEPANFSMEVISPGLEALDLAVDAMGAIYATDNNQGQLLRIDPDNELEVLARFDLIGNVAVAVDANNTVFLGRPNGEISSLNNAGALEHYADVMTQRMVFAQDNMLYAVAGEEGMNKSIVRIAGIDDIETIASEIDGISLGNGAVHITPAQDLGLYIYCETEGNLFFMDYKGQGHLLGNYYELGQSRPTLIAASPTTGEIYFVPHGLYALYRIDVDGAYERIGSGMVGDPSGMVVSDNGKYLYIAESGAIDIIPISK